MNPLLLFLAWLLAGLGIEVETGTPPACGQAMTCGLAPEPATSETDDQPTHGNRGCAADTIYNGF